MLAALTQPISACFMFAHVSWVGMAALVAKAVMTSVGLSHAIALNPLRVYARAGPGRQLSAPPAHRPPRGHLARGTAGAVLAAPQRTRT